MARAGFPITAASGSVEMTPVRHENQFDSRVSALVQRIAVSPMAVTVSAGGPVPGDNGAAIPPFCLAGGGPSLDDHRDAKRRSGGSACAPPVLEPRDLETERR
jgi:hypothetical protein